MTHLIRGDVSTSLYNFFRDSESRECIFTCSARLLDICLVYYWSVVYSLYNIRVSIYWSSLVESSFLTHFVTVNRNRNVWSVICSCNGLTTFSFTNSPFHPVPFHPFGCDDDNENKSIKMPAGAMEEGSLGWVSL